MYKPVDFWCMECDNGFEKLIDIPSGGSILGQVTECPECGGESKSTLSPVSFLFPSAERTLDQLKKRSTEHTKRMREGGEPEPGGKPYLARRGGKRKSNV